jgi:transposase-like protein
MINWELPHEKIACPHCGSTDTHIALQLLGLIRYSCSSCKKSFAVKNDTAVRPGDKSGAPPDDKGIVSFSALPRES